MNKNTNCNICSVLLTGKQTKYCSLKCKNLAHQSYPSQKKRGLSRKLTLIKALGGECGMCGYKTNLAALAFHHLRDKEFQLDVRALSNRKLNAVLLELDKCILLCNNCHAEVHNPSLDLSKLLN